MEGINLNTFYLGDARDVLSTFPDISIDCCVTSPPYYGLRDYGVSGQLGLEQTPNEYIEKLVDVFREVRRVLKDNGTLWVVIGDSYNGSGKAGSNPEYMGKHTSFGKLHNPKTYGRPIKIPGLKPKDLIGIPWMLAFALRADGWYLRQDIIWCISGGTWLYAKTQKGEMPIMVKDLVRLDPTTVQLWNGSAWIDVLGCGESNDTDRRIEIVLRSGERIGCTGNHLWPTHRGNVDAKDLKIGDIIQSCKLPEPHNAYTPNYLTSDILWLLGLYLAEGSHADDTIQISLNIDEKKWLPRINEAAAQTGASVSYSECGNSLNIRIYGKVINAIIADFIVGVSAKTKHFSAKTWKLPNDSLKCIADGYLDGDGHYDITNNRWRLGFTRNYSLERDLRTLAARLGAIITLKLSESVCRTGKFKSFRGEWRWDKSMHLNTKDRGEIIKIRKSRARKFWDIAVSGDPHLFSLASGVLTHNCKPNPMPESVRDRCTKSHEYIFLLSKSAKYYFDSQAIAEPVANSTIIRCSQDLENQKGSDRAVGKTNGNMKACLPRYEGNKYTASSQKFYRTKSGDIYEARPLRNKRSIWTVSTKPFKDAHFATFPDTLIVDCIKAGCPPEGVVLDPFIGSGTTAVVALKEGRQYVGIELNPEYIGIAEKRIAGIK